MEMQLGSSLISDLLRNSIISFYIAVHDIPLLAKHETHWSTAGAASLVALAASISTDLGTETSSTDLLGSSPRILLFSVAEAPGFDPGFLEPFAELLDSEVASDAQKYQRRSHISPSWVKQMDSFCDETSEPRSTKFFHVSKTTGSWKSEVITNFRTYEI